ncbi:MULTISPECIES: site-specific integrase [unclassified Streptomyces]|uniref:tyrosine-type recombinase/integrase n=1 Tax=unclassified Streptomyces TaxID=2593676 RepID=UPI001E37B2B4|nr:site-specific integrase [Streptomyces sp. CB02980]MCB8908362.1 site-specific integrase [Streptomyces sp. CB02980]
MPSGQKYWTVLDDDLEVVPVADRWLRNLRFGRDRAELTTKAYAGGVALYLRWCGWTGREWETAGRDLGLFMVWLKYTPAPQNGVAPVVRSGPGAAPVRGERRINRVLVAVRGLLSYAVSVSEAPRSLLGQIYELADSRDLPVQARGEDGGLFYRLRPVHQLREPEAEVDRALDAELVAMFGSCRSARDRLIVLLVGRVGLRRGQFAGLRRSDVHLLPDSRALGCDYPGAHVHVRRRENANGAWSKSRHTWVAPLDFLVVAAFDLYYEERHRLLGIGGSDFLLVNLFRAPLGGPVPPEAIGDLLERLSKRAGLERRVGAHMARRAFASNVSDAGGSEDEVQALLGHKSPDSSGPYRFPDPGRVRAAVERVPSPRLQQPEGDR